METQDTKRIVAVLDDLFFTVKISDAAKRSGVTVDFVKTKDMTIEKAGTRPLVIILDLNCQSVHPIDLIRELKSREDTKEVSLLGYVSHVQGDLRQAAHEAGCDTVLARSAFSQNIVQILKRHCGNG